MPIRLIPPRQGKTPYYSGRGTYLGIYVDRSTKARKRAVAAKVIEKWEREIERGEFSVKGESTFADAALAYMNAGGERRFVVPLLRHFENTAARLIDQAAIDHAADAILPRASGATRNRQVYTPMRAILGRAGFGFDLKRPQGAQGNKATSWLWPEDAEKMFLEAGKFDAEFRLLLLTLLYGGGLRLSEGLRLGCDDVRLSEGFAYLPDSKNGDPRPIFLPEFLVAELANHPRGLDRTGERVFRFAKGGHIYSLLYATAARAGVTLPERSAFHIFCHTYATWMRRYGGLDTKGLVGTRRWKDRKSVDRYEHVVTSEEQRRASLLPVPRRASGNAP